MSDKSDSNENILSGLVAQIINARELAINIGSQHGVTEGMRFAVLAKSPLEIRDPVSEKVLDVIDREKVRIEASQVRGKISICKTYRTHYIPGGALFSGSIMELTRPSRTEVESFKTDTDSYPEPLSEEDSYVKIGDRVVAIEDDQ